MQPLVAPASCSNAPVYDCSMDHGGNYKILKFFNALQPSQAAHA